MKHEGWAAEAPSPAHRRLLERYHALLKSRAIPAGLIAVGDASDLMERHILDSLRGASLVPADVHEAVDLGTGAGLPGIPLAIVLPHVRFDLVDSRRNRIAFLELVLDELRLPNARVVATRVEDLPRAFDLCVARGFAPPAATWAAAERVLRPTGRLLYWAGETFDVSSVTGSVRLEVVGQAGLESEGPIVIMARQ